MLMKYIIEQRPFQKAEQPRSSAIDASVKHYRKENTLKRRKDKNYLIQRSSKQRCFDRSCPKEISLCLPFPGCFPQLSLCLFDIGVPINYQFLSCVEKSFFFDGIVALFRFKGRHSCLSLAWLGSLLILLFGGINHSVTADVLHRFLPKHSFARPTHSIPRGNPMVKEGLLPLIPPFFKLTPSLSIHSAPSPLLNSLSINHSLLHYLSPFVP